MSEKLTDAEVDETLRGIRTIQDTELSGLRWQMKYSPCVSTLDVMRQSIYERRIAALDQVLAERRERKHGASGTPRSQA